MNSRETTISSPVAESPLGADRTPDPGPRSLWDPAAAWPAGRKSIWAVLAVLVLLAQGPTFLGDIFVKWEDGTDFFQDWASARNVLDGRPAYSPISDSIDRFVPRAPGSHPPRAHLPWNAHPPTSVLAILPLGFLDYPLAATLWNLLGLGLIVASLGLLARELRLPVPLWSVLPIAAMGLLCGPIRTQISQGQWNAPLLWLLTVAWVALRRGRDSWAGACTGIAIALKLYPALFLVQFLIQRRWRAMATACLSAAAMALLSLGVVGIDAFRDYERNVVPSLGVFRAEWVNASLHAFWIKNLDVGASHYGIQADPPLVAPSICRAGIVLSTAAILIGLFMGLRRPRRDLDRAGPRPSTSCGLTLVSMLLLAPICWDHYLLLLALPLALIWVSLGPSTAERLAFLLLVAAVWAAPDLLWRAAGVDVMSRWPDFQEVPPGTYRIHQPSFVPVFLSIHFYALLATFVWLLILAERAAVRGDD